MTYRCWPGRGRDDPYDACRNAWDARTAPSPGGPIHAPAGDQAVSRSVPAIWGWCSWEEYRSKIDEKILLAAVDSIESSGLPVRWLLVDNGYVDEAGRRLIGFPPNSKFPRGWAPLLARRKPDQIRWMGLWLNFNGYWSGIHPENKLGALNEHLEKMAGGRRGIEGDTLQPRPRL